MRNIRSAKGLASVWTVSRSYSWGRLLLTDSVSRPWGSPGTPRVPPSGDRRVERVIELATEHLVFVHPLSRACARVFPRSKVAEMPPLS